MAFLVAGSTLWQCPRQVFSTSCASGHCWAWCSGLESSGWTWSFWWLRITDLHEKEISQILVSTTKGPLSTVGFPPWVSEVQVGRVGGQPVMPAFLPHFPRSETDSAPRTWAAPLRVVLLFMVAPLPEAAPHIRASKSAQQGLTILFFHRNLNFQCYYIFKNLNPQAQISLQWIKKNPIKQTAISLMHGFSKHKHSILFQ